MNTLITALLLTVTALAADPAPITRPEQILALVPDETRPRGGGAVEIALELENCELK